jgi:hypothetical protein
MHGRSHPPRPRVAPTPELHLGDGFGSIPSEQQLGHLTQLKAASVRIGFEDPHEIEAVVGPGLGHGRPVSDEPGGDERKPFVFPGHEHVPFTAADDLDELVQLVLEKGLVEPQAKSLAERQQRFQRPPTVAVRADLRGEQAAGRRKERDAELVRPREEQTAERPGPLPPPWRE